MLQTWAKSQWHWLPLQVLSSWNNRQFQKILFSPTLWMVTGNSEEEGSKKTKLFKGKYESTLKFLEWWGVHPPPPPKKNPRLMGGRRIFSGTSQCWLIDLYLSFRQSTWYKRACFSLSSCAMDTIAFLYFSSVSLRLSYILYKRQT